MTPLTDFLLARIAEDEATIEDADRRRLLSIAAKYADHPDYREEWRP